MERRKGFTLVELLVVIGIIALLISILLPSLMKAKRQAIWAQCSSNLRNCGEAMFAYASDNKGALPQYYYNGTSPAATGTNAGGFWMWDMEIPTRNALVHYGATRNTLYCPANNMNVDGLWNYSVITYTGTPPNQTATTGYCVLGYVFLTTRPDPGYRDPTQSDDYGPYDHWNYQSKLRPQNTPALALPSLVRPNISSETELVCDAVVSNNPSPPASFGNIQGGYAINGHVVPTTSSHYYDGQVPKGGNILFMDGHVSLRPLVFPQVGNPPPGSVMVRRAKVVGSAGSIVFWW
jgi:prepilin-type N-terminal cleavage/methylation domain-containing protein/prepilin-type processing-associated H-X9-DG protein